jgi:pimeloyl-ACP methyl ester carboxylesterase
MGNQQTVLAKHSIDTPSGRISYTEAGSGPVALFAHGVVLNKHVWRRQLTGLSGRRL